MSSLTRMSVSPPNPREEIDDHLKTLLKKFDLDDNVFFVK